MFSATNLLPCLLVFLVIKPCFSIDSITANQTLKDGQLLISQGKTFELGFFSPGSSSNRYVGVWYHNFPQRYVVWVANRDSPLRNSSGVLTLNKSGQLALVYSQAPEVPIWSTNISLSGNNNSARLLDTGNLVMFKNTFSQKNILWEGFDHPTDTYLPEMKVGVNKKTGDDLFISSWKSPDDPGTGQYSYRIVVNGSVPQLFIYDGLKPSMGMGPWNGITFSGLPAYGVDNANQLSQLYYIDNNEEVSNYYTITNSTYITRSVMDYRGTAQRLDWNAKSKSWKASWTGPDGQCDKYVHCGAYSTCNSFRVANQGCDCLPGYKDKYEGGSPTNSFAGCVGKPGASLCRNGEGFKKVPGVRVPDTFNAELQLDLDIKACGDLCLKNCSCTAYAAARITSDKGCLTWYGELIDVREFSDGGQDIYVRVDRGELDKDSKKGILKVLLPVIFTIVLILVIACWLLRKMKRERKKRNQKLSYGSESDDIAFMEHYSDVHASNERGTTSAEVHCFSLSTIIAATEDFSFANKLGEGGFGTVYKGRMRNGQDIAVKRLSITSKQGLEEFRNEIILIAKLQHRNLVRLLGYCIQQENMLIYEYLPNRGLDRFIFGGKTTLDWRARFDITMGIARGMIYLHHDSRLRIIHRDLKASNVLLDASMKPKISDFGMARIFGSDQNEDKTNRVVGTYGYMSPEYAMEGHFSIKSDVFSFGVLLLEIISGRKNTSTFDAENSVNLIGHVWDRWLEGKPLEVVDSSLGESYEASEVLRCIHTALLCVQESAAVRPTMSEVASMLCNERTLPSPPEQPAFINRGNGYFGSVTSQGGTTVTEVTVSIVEGR